MVLQTTSGPRGRQPISYASRGDRSSRRRICRKGTQPREGFTGLYIPKPRGRRATVGRSHCVSEIYPTCEDLVRQLHSPRAIFKRRQGGGSSSPKQPHHPRSCSISPKLIFLPPQLGVPFPTPANRRTSPVALSPEGAFPCPFASRCQRGAKVSVRRPQRETGGHEAGEPFLSRIGHVACREFRAGNNKDEGEVPTSQAQSHRL